jgi:hypothetical protein
MLNGAPSTAGIEGTGRRAPIGRGWGVHPEGFREPLTFSALEHPGRNRLTRKRILYPDPSFSDGSGTMTIVTETGDLNLNLLWHPRPAHQP